MIIHTLKKMIYQQYYTILIKNYTILIKNNFVHTYDITLNEIINETTKLCSHFNKIFYVSLILLLSK